MATSQGLTFKGWSDAALDFYRQLEVHNDKGWWTEHKAVYEDEVRAPFDALSELVADEFGELRVFRPYRDTRFSKDKAPYKTRCYGVTEGEGGEAYYVEISAAGLVAASGYWMMAKDQLERYRAAVDDERAGTALADGRGRGPQAQARHRGPRAQDRATRLPAGPSAGRAAPLQVARRHAPLRPGPVARHQGRRHPHHRHLACRRTDQPVAGPPTSAPASPPDDRWSR